MKIFKKTLSLLLVLSLVISLFSSLNFGANAETTVTSGTTGDCTWTLDGTELTISGNGKMGDNTVPWGTDITKVVIKKGVTSIGDYAFRGCSALKNITIPDSVTNVGCSPFDGTAYYNDQSNWENDGLYIGKHLIRVFGKDETYKIKSGTLTVAGRAFSYRSSLKSVIIPSSVKSIGCEAFAECASLKSVTIPTGVISIGDKAFLRCTSLESVAISDSVINISNTAFGGCRKLTSLTVDSGNTIYHSSGNCIIETATKTLIIGLGNSVIPNDGSVSSIYSAAFSGLNGIENITFPDTLVSIGDSAFSGCTNLKSVTLPDTVRNIDTGAFSDCTNLKSITLPDTVISIGVNAFSNTAYYNDSANWEDGVLYIGKHLIKALGQDGTCTIKSGTLDIAVSAASGGNTLLKNIVIPDSVKYICEYAFGGCTSLEIITIPDSVISIGAGAFYNTAYYNNSSNR